MDDVLHGQERALSAAYKVPCWVCRKRIKLGEAVAWNPEHPDRRKRTRHIRCQVTEDQWARWETWWRMTRREQELAGFRIAARRAAEDAEKRRIMAEVIEDIEAGWTEAEELLRPGPMPRSNVLAFPGSPWAGTNA